MLFISIIVPVFNRKGYIGRCIDSILKQTFTDYEIIIVDDGSYDGTEKICDSYERTYDNIKVIHQKNSGVSKARNEGIKAAEGQYVTFIDSDDHILPDYLQRIKDAYEKYGQGVTYCTSFKVDTEDGSMYLQHGRNTEFSFIKNDVLPLFYDGIFYTVINKIYCMSIIKKYKIRFPDKLSLGEDLVFNLCYVDKLKEINFLLLNHNFYHLCRKNREHSLEEDWRQNYFEIQRLLLRQKMKYINRWVDKRKLQPNSRRIFPQWYYNCIWESIDYYIVNIRHAGAITIVGQLVKIKHSSEYVMCVQLNNSKKGFFVKMLYRAWKGYLKR